MADDNLVDKGMPDEFLEELETLVRNFENGDEERKHPDILRELFNKTIEGTKGVETYLNSDAIRKWIEELNPLWLILLNIHLDTNLRVRRIERALLTPGERRLSRSSVHYHNKKLLLALSKNFQNDCSPRWKLMAKTTVEKPKIWEEG